MQTVCDVPWFYFSRRFCSSKLFFSQVKPRNCYNNCYKKGHILCFCIRQASKNGLCDQCSKTTQEHSPTARNSWDSRTCHPTSSHTKVQVRVLYSAFSMSLDVFVSTKACWQNIFEVINSSLLTFPFLSSYWLETILPFKSCMPLCCVCIVIAHFSKLPVVNCPPSWRVSGCCCFIPYYANAA